MHCRQRLASPVPPRGKKPATAVPGGFAPAVAGTLATRGSCTPTSRSRHDGGSRATNALDIGPNPASPWFPRGTAPPSAGGGHSPPSVPAAPTDPDCSKSNGWKKGTGTFTGRQELKTCLPPKSLHGPGRQTRLGHSRRMFTGHLASHSVTCSASTMGEMVPGEPSR
jgi:hypothetical protein